MSRNRAGPIDTIRQERRKDLPQAAADVDGRADALPESAIAVDQAAHLARQSAGMRSDDELRALVDRQAEVVPFEARQEPRKAVGGSQLRLLSTVWADEIEITLDRSGVIDGLLPRAGMTVLYGESGVGKTFVAIDIACHVATGRPWCGMAVEQGNVVYVAAEGPESVERRLLAWKRRHDAGNLPVLVVRTSVDLLNGDLAALVELVTRISAEHGRVSLVVIDTLARAMTGNENAPDDMGRFVAACTRIREAGSTHA